MNRWLLAALAAALAARVGLFVRDTGELSSLSNYLAHTGRCKKLQPHLRGFEDLAVFDEGEMVALSSDHSHFAFKFGNTMREALVQRLRHSGGISPVRAVAIRADGTVHDFELRGRPEDFFPHGIAASPTRLGGGVLLVVNHRSTHDTLEVFSVDESGAAATHVRSVSHQLLFNVNDCALAAWTARHVAYCTNWRSGETGTLYDAIEVYGQRAWTNVVRCEWEGADAASCVEVAGGLAMANGIEVRGDRVFVIASASLEMIVYQTGGDHRLVELHRVHTGAACDNLVWDGDALLTACHPKVSRDIRRGHSAGPRAEITGARPQALTFVAYSKDPDRRHAPCLVRRFDGVLGEQLPGAGKVVYLDANGTEISACSVAAVGSDGALVVGSVHDFGLLRCEP